MALWTDIIDPATLTGYARASLADYEARKGTLARWLPNREVADIVARFVAGQNGLVPVADFRAFDAEPTIGKSEPGKRVSIELPAVGQNIPVSEYNQLRALGASPSDEAVLVTIQKTTDRVVRAVSDAVERQRGVVLHTGKATIAGEGGFSMDDDFGRSVGHTVTADESLLDPSIDFIGMLTEWCDTYADDNGEETGVVVASRAVLRRIRALDQMRTVIAGGGSRPASAAQVAEVLDSSSLPPIVTYDRRVKVGNTTQRVLPEDSLMLLPAAVDVDAYEETDLGATFWGRTLSSVEAAWGIEDAEQPGLVAGVYRNEKPPMIAEVISDAIALPVLANADLSFVVNDLLEPLDES